jgi:two-component system, sensor histidine kinase and response regulator
MNQKIAEDLILSLTTAGIYVLNEKGETTFMNPSAAQIMKVKPEDILYRQNAFLTHLKSNGEPYAVGESPINKTLSEGTVHHANNEAFKRVDGTCFPVEYTSAPILEGGKISGAVVTFRDVTKQKQLEAQLVRSKEEAVGANRAKSDFLANMSHEIRTPLNAVIGFCELLKDGDLNGQQRDYVRTIGKSGEALLGLVSDVLDVSKIEAGQVCLEDINFNLERLIETVLKIGQGKALSKHVDLRYEYASDGPSNFVGDPTRMRQILLNLIGNAVKFTQQGEIKIKVKFLNQSDQRCLIQITVSDTGIGIPKETMKHIFDPFSQGDMSTTRKYGGTGLGLAITKRFVEMMGGKIWVESEEQKGSSFIFTIHLSQAPSMTLAEITPLKHEEMKGKAILIIEADTNSRQILENYCNDFGLDVVKTVTSGEEGTAWLEQVGMLPEVILCDVLMAGMDGYQFVRNVKAQEKFRGLKIIAVSSEAVPGTARLAEKAGFDAYLPKPIIKEDLRKVIETTLGDRRIGEHQIVTRHLSDEIMFKGMKILVAEDHPVNQKLVRILLKNLGCDADIVGNGKEVLDKLNESEYTLCLMDLQMPVMGGIEATQEIRKSSKSAIPIIALTSAAMKKDKDKCFEVGMNDFLAKPINMVQLKEVLRKWGSQKKATESDA